MLRTLKYATSQTQQLTHGLSPGCVISGFEVRQQNHIKELDIMVYRLKHLKTGANYIHLWRDDINSVFAIGFCTVPVDNSGVAHILEHSVLCGSKRYPVRDPFFKMTNRSLSNYMNAWTLSDHTLYPFSTENAEDFANLRDVYYDACFNPLLREEDFWQEGWRLTVEEPMAKPRIKGVVYNEMKGAMSDPDAVFADAWQKVLFEGTTYGVNSGGDPACIPKLAHGDLVAFHRQHYHPGNAVFLSYGRLLEDNLQYLDLRLNETDLGINRKGICPGIKGLRPIAEPVSCVVDGPVDPMGTPNTQHRFLAAFRTNQLIKVQETFHMQLLSHLLLDGPSSPMYKALIESGLGSEYSCGTGYSQHGVITTFGLGVQGCSADSVSRVQDVIWSTLRRVMKDGVPRDRIDSALHQIQLSLKYKSASFGLNLVASVMAGWVRGIYPVDQLCINDKVREFERRLNRKHVLEPLIEKWLLGNKERVELLMRPDPQFDRKLVTNEEALTSLIYSNLSEDQARDLRSENDNLDRSQSAATSVDGILPILQLSSISPDIKKPSLPILDNSPANDILVYHKKTLQANGVTYLRLLKCFDCPPPHLHLLQLALSMFTEYGVLGRTTDEYEEAVKKTCSNITFSPILKSTKDFRLMISVHSLDENRDNCLELLSETLNRTDYSRDLRLRAQIMSMAASLSNSICTSGHHVAMSVAAAKLGGKFMLADAISGLDQIRSAVQLAEYADLSDIVGKIKEIHRFILQGPGKWRVAVIANDAATWLEQPITRVIGQLAANNISSVPFAPPNHNCYQDVEYEPVMRFPINTGFAAASVLINNICNCPNEKSHLLLVAELLKSKYLHREIREKGGAYGAGASFSHLDSLFSFYSSRDPSPEESLKAFKASIKWLREEALLSANDLLEAKLSVIGSIDTPVDLGEEGLAHFKYDLDDNCRHQMRKAILAATSEDIRNASLLLSQSDLSTCIIKGHE